MELGNSSFVITGEGLTPHLLRAEVLSDVFKQPPVQALTTPVLTVLQYPDGFQVLVQPDRLEVRKEQPPAGKDETLQQAVRKLKSLWPLLQPTGIGVNFFLGVAYDERFTKDSVTDRIVRSDHVERALGESLGASEHTFVFHTDGVQITLKLGTNGRINGRPGLGIDFNAHYGPVHNFEAVLQSQGSWLERAQQWSGRLIDDN